MPLVIIGKIILVTVPKLSRSVNQQAGFGTSQKTLANKMPLIAVMVV
jgi:hypothetical protein